MEARVQSDQRYSSGLASQRLAALEAEVRARNGTIKSLGEKYGTSYYFVYLQHGQAAGCEVPALQVRSQTEAQPATRSGPTRGQRESRLPRQKVRHHARTAAADRKADRRHLLTPLRQARLSVVFNVPQ